MPNSLHIQGHGLAGAILAECAHQRGVGVHVSHDNGPSSSRIAAGLFTPATGNKITLTWLIDVVLPRMQEFYPFVEQITGAVFYHPTRNLRILRQALRNAPDPRWFQTIAPDKLPVPAPHGALEILHSGWVNLNAMLDALQARRETLGQWNTQPPADAVTVCCSGYQAANHPLWQEAGWRNAHGDVLTLRIPDLPEDTIFNFGKFLLPVGNHCFRLGATYDWGTKTPTPRDAGRRELEEAADTFLPMPFDILAHEAGIRPVALARVPIIGPHPEERDQWIFNGFGSKGVLYAPAMADRFLDWFEHGIKPEKELQAPRRLLRQRERRKHGHSDV